MEKALVGGLEKGYGGMLMVSLVLNVDACGISGICRGYIWSVDVHGCDGVFFAHVEAALGVVSE